MWTYEQSTGDLSQDGRRVAVGYSGAGEDKNKPESQNLHDRGPIPQGRYHIDGPVELPHKGPCAFRLVPNAANQMFGRGGFLIHADAFAAPGTASSGCIILSPGIRQLIAESSDRELEVVA